ncbi:MAG TPA: hypothetical protein VI603_12985 [Saprospiraceae bacterium]|nr:hypothetical protein [Saprospiraceae bacterium]
MKTSDVNTVIEKFNSLQLEEKEFAIDIIKKAYAEALRADIAKRAHKATINYRKGKVKRGGADALFKDLDGASMPKK